MAHDECCSTFAPPIRDELVAPAATPPMNIVPAIDELITDISADKDAAWCSIHCIVAASALNAIQIDKCPTPNSALIDDARGSPRDELIPAKRRSVGAALAVIIPTIITDHMMNVK